MNLFPLNITTWRTQFFTRFMWKNVCLEFVRRFNGIYRFASKLPLSFRFGTITRYQLSCSSVNKLRTLILYTLCFVSAHHVFSATSRRYGAYLHADALCLCFGFLERKSFEGRAEKRTKTRLA